VKQLVRRAGVRMIGPNCMGVINSDPEISMNATFAPTPAQRGSVGFVSQFTQFVSMGNKADVTGNDLVEHWEHDDATRVICMYLESFGNPRHFTEIAKRVGRRKPILMVKSGRTEEGARAASSHTGAIAGADVTVSTFLAHCGVLRANTIDELFGVAQALDKCPPPEGDRVGVFTNAGGPGIMATDALVNSGLQMAEFSKKTRDALAKFLPAEASLDNPVDMIASAGTEDYRRTLTLLLDDPGVDMVLAINVTPLLTNPIDVMAEIGAVVRKKRAKPVLAVMMATEDFYDEVKARPDLPPVFRFPESAAQALAQLHSYGTWRRRPADEKAPEFQTDDEAVGEILSRFEDTYLPAEEAFRVLELYGIPVIPWRVASSPDQATAAARELGFPVAIKAEAAGLVHKSDLGAVRLGLEDPGAVSNAVAEIDIALTAADLRGGGYLVQRMGNGGHEVIFGISSDPRFGPLLAFGLGGRYVEVWRDVRFGVTPLSPSEAREMIEGIRGYELLKGVRGERGADIRVLIEVLLRIAQLASRHPRITELDINPFIAAPDRQRALALDARLRVGPPDPADLGSEP
jgi:acyl-CoA synthetase (NDP forming)